MKLDDSVLQALNNYSIVEITLDKDFESIIGEASDIDGDELSIVGLQVQGVNSVLRNGYKVEINDRNQLILKGKTNTVIGYTILKFWVSDGMREEIVKSSYTPRYVVVTTINHPPKVKISKPKIILNKKDGLKRDLIIATFKDPDGDNSPYTATILSRQGEEIVHGNIVAEDNKIIMKATLTGKPGIRPIGFILHDKFQVYSEIPEIAMFAIKSVNVPPKANVRSELHILGLEEQTFTLGSITDADNDTEFEIEEFTKLGKQLWDTASLFVEDNEIKLKVKPSKYNCGETKISFVLHDTRKKYTRGDPHRYTVNLIFENRPPTLVQSCLSFVMPNGTTIKKEIGVIEDADGDENFTVTVLERNKDNNDPAKPCNVVNGTFVVEDDKKLYLNITAAEGRVGTEVIKFIINDTRREYTQGTQRKYSIKIEVI